MRTRRAVFALAMAGALVHGVVLVKVLTMLLLVGAVALIAARDGGRV